GRSRTRARRTRRGPCRPSPTGTRAGTVRRAAPAPRRAPRHRPAAPRPARARPMNRQPPPSHSAAARRSTTAAGWPGSAVRAPAGWSRADGSCPVRIAARSVPQGLAVASRVAERGRCRSGYTPRDMAITQDPAPVRVLQPEAEGVNARVTIGAGEAVVGAAIVLLGLVAWAGVALARR